MLVDLNLEAPVDEGTSSESDCIIVGGYGDFSEEDDDVTNEDMVEKNDVQDEVQDVGVEGSGVGIDEDVEPKVVVEAPMVGIEVQDVGVEGSGVGIEEDVEPKVVVEAPMVGKVFSSLEAVDVYYRSYGKQQGFGVVRAAGSVYRGVDGVKKPLRNSIWTCDRFGRPKRKRKGSGNKFVTDAQDDVDDPVGTSKKIDCCAMIYASVNSSGEWEIKKAVNVHRNHAPIPAMSKHIFQHRIGELTNYMKRKLRIGVKSGLSVAQLYNMIVTERNGYEEVGLTKRDIRNELAKDKRLKMRAGDSNAMVAYFKKMTEGNQNFFHTYRLDSNGYMQDILWVDARSRAAYLEFGDVVCFDTTYLTNEYELPFANFVGVNHHGQSILLGCALISHETTETFQWVFSSWLHCMEGKYPLGILTDQAAAMRKALAVEMPHSRHRWCIWHITSKFGDKLGRQKKYLRMKEALLRSIYNSFSIEEFESSWKGVLDKYGLHGNKWLKGLYEEKEMWVPAFMKQYFWAGMKTTQRVESIHSFFDEYINKHTRLHEFAESYCKAMESRAEDERRADAHSETYRRQVVHGFPIEYVFQRCYTDKKFKEVLRECSRIVFLNFLDKVVISDHVLEYDVEDRIWCRNKVTRKEFVTERTRKYKIRYNSASKFAECSCLFERNGIMCRHIIKLFDILGLKDVPYQYVLRRWRKDIDRAHSKVKVAYHEPSKNSHVSRFDKLQVAFEPICSKAAAYSGTVDVVMELLKMMDIKVDEKIKLIESDLCSRKTSHAGNEEKERCDPDPKGGSDVYDLNDSPGIKEPPSHAKPHRTTSHRYYSRSEKSKKVVGKGKRAKGASNADDEAAKATAEAQTKAPSKRRKRKEVALSLESLDGTPLEELSLHIGNGGSNGRCNEFMDPQSSVGISASVARTARVLFPESANVESGFNLHSKSWFAEDMLRL